MDLAAQAIAERDINRLLSSERKLSKQRYEDRHVIHALIATAVAAAVIVLITCILSVTTILAAVAFTVLGVAILIGAVVAFSLTVVFVNDFFEDLRRHSDIDKMKNLQNILVQSIIRESQSKELEGIAQKMSEENKKLFIPVLRSPSIQNIWELLNSFPQSKKNNSEQLKKTQVELSLLIDKTIKKTKANLTFIFLEDLENHIRAVGDTLLISAPVCLKLTDAKALCDIMQIVREKQQKGYERFQDHAFPKELEELINKLCLEAEILLITNYCFSFDR